VNAFILAARARRQGKKEQREVLMRAIVRSLAEDKKNSTYSSEIHVTPKEKMCFDAVLEGGN
jgi:hypothetical protein